MNVAATRRPNRLHRWWLRAPLALYRFRVGRVAVGELALWVYGHPHVRVVHRGRRSGQRREVVLEVLEIDDVSGELFVAAMWGPGSDWYRNLEASPALEVEFRGQRFTPTQRLLPESDGQEVLDRYRARHRIWSTLMRRFINRPFTASSMPVVALGR
jgi:deazaflavin-dependent oxidoreductase (nitroreductase family)